MNKIYFLLLSFMIVAHTASAQDTTATYLKSGLFKLNLVLPGAAVTYEQRVSRNNTVVAEAALLYGFYYTYNSFAGSIYRYSIAPVVGVEGRHYYHFTKRLAKGRNISNNGSNFWAFKASYSMSPIAKTKGYEYEDHMLYLLPNWGIQRTVGKSFSLEVHAGPQFAYSPSSEHLNIYPAGDIKFGYIIK